ncbi:hypothetical protein A11A3_07068 [Alcanivorax hongdengensis A-11-3]|uniref:Anti-sigma K factor RskA C-terminal domain-containing protein n=1 Tax=Alcanivorax hongdengensis A-11-3 TaxID=1177179 RepID=L0WCN6_9GAMM|nr:anti-sigma factor [Alcanivorax hongdengensis]EKF74764.1 hypothetical protein A11A3_07068 [Alcanivorax hongdengensis A-11-3]
MKPDHYERGHALAAEYVIGTLQGKARRRFERWMMESPRLRRQVWYWERNFQPLNHAVEPVVPPPQAWNNIDRRLFGTPRQAAERVAPWRWAAGLAMVALLAVLVWTPYPTAPAPVVGYLGVVQDQQSQPLWLLDASQKSHELTLKALPTVPAPGPNQSYELWLLPTSGAPVSLALLPTGGAELRVTLSPDQLQDLLRSRHLAISIEPAGGSPTGQPTGPVVYQTRLVSL